MNFDLEISVSALTVLLQGLLSFFSPCVLPLVPLYVGYFAGNAGETGEDGRVRYPRRRVLIHTVCFVLGISAAFFLLGFGFTALGRFLSGQQRLFAIVSGAIMILFGLYRLGALGQVDALERERRLPFRLNRVAMGPLPALLLGFTFSFAWTPCVGPTLSSVLLLAGSSGSAARGLGLIGVYTLGFVLPFLAVGLFTGTVLEFFEKHRHVVRYTVRAGALLLIVMGVMTISGMMSGLSGYLSGGDGLFQERAQSAVTPQAPDADAAEMGTDGDAPQAPADEAAGEADADGAEEPADAPREENAAESAGPQRKVFAPDFTLTDQDGRVHTLSDYRGQTVFLNFWATWCPPCRSEMPEIQALYERYGLNEGDLVVLGVAAPNIGQEGDRAAVTAFLADNGYSFPVAMDDGGLMTVQYGIRAYPTTFMISADGSVFGYVEGALTGEIMESIVRQTMDAGET